MIEKNLSKIKRRIGHGMEANLTLLPGVLIKFSFNDVLSVHVDNIFGNCENVCQNLTDWPVKWSEGGQGLGLGN